MAMALLTGCPGVEPEPDPTVTFTGVIQNMPGSGSHVLKLVDDEDDAELAETSVAADGSFSLELPANYGSGVLLSPDWMFDIPGMVTFSDPATKLGSTSLILYRDGEDVGILIYGEYREGVGTIYSSDGWLIYSDRNCDIDGSFVDESIPVTFDISFKKGWNWIFEIYEANGEGESLRMVSGIPSGSRLYYPRSF